jgi:UDP-glucuronate decarboxylase
VTYRPLPQDDPTQRKPDITRARQWLGWEPTVPLAEGLVRTVEYFRRRLARRNRATAARLDPSEDLPSRQDGTI